MFVFFCFVTVFGSSKKFIKVADCKERPSFSVPFFSCWPRGFCLKPTKGLSLLQEVKMSKPSQTSKKTTLNPLITMWLCFLRDLFFLGLLKVLFGNMFAFFRGFGGRQIQD